MMIFIEVMQRIVGLDQEGEFWNGCEEVIVKVCQRFEVLYEDVTVLSVSEVWLTQVGTVSNRQKGFNDHYVSASRNW